jgi:DNA helicase-2/ATP-dependent DNA helicase PcrA
MKQKNTAFDAAYARLNAAQREAVDAIEGPVMVIAGPGTGKTQLLSVRIAHILQKTDTPPSGILALTFTDSGVRAMRERLTKLIGPAGSEVPVLTFHSFASMLVSQFPEFYPTIIGSLLATEVEQIGVITQIIDQGTWIHLRPAGDPAYYISPIRSALSELKREYQTPESLEAWCAAERSAILANPDAVHTKGKYQGKMKGQYERELRQLERTIELALVYRAYETAMREKKRHDYDDLIVETVRALTQHESFLREIQERYLYVLADEHQDVNAAQNALLESIASFHESPNLFVVGDEKQAIFRFQGASLANFLYFKRRYPDAAIIVLSENYRSTAPILDAAHTLITQSASAPDLPRVPLYAHGGDGVPITIRSFATYEDERAHIAEDIARAIEAGEAPEEIAVLYRANQDAAGISRALATRGIVHRIESDFDALTDPHIVQFCALLAALDQFGDDTLVAPLLYYRFTDIAPSDAHKLIVSARTKRCSILDVLAECPSDSAPRKFHDLLVRMVRVKSEQSVPEFIEIVARESGFTAYLIAHPRAPEKLAKFRALLQVAESLQRAAHTCSLADFMQHLIVMRENRVRMSIAQSRTPTGAVRLMTVHKSKGLEFNRVYITDVVDKAWGNRTSRRLFRIPYGIDGVTQDTDDDDERRLLYVAITRARTSAIISHAAQADDGSMTSPSRFLDELALATVVHESHESYRAPILAETVPSTSPIAERAYLQHLFVERGMTVTALNNYLACPWRYFFTNLIRLPEAKNESAYFGTAIHAGLHAALTSAEKLRSTDRALERFKGVLADTPLTESSIRQLTLRGSRALSGYCAARADFFTPGVMSEVRLSATLEVSGLPEPLKVSGAIDAIMHADTALCVIDFKTGKPKSRGHISGTTRTKGSGDYLRQLSFYRLLMQLADRGDVSLGVIDFVEPTVRGEYVTESFELTQQHTDSCIQELTLAATEIYALAFWNRTCGEADCRFCQLRGALVDLH